MTTEERLAEIEARANAATPGPWQIGVSIDRTYGSWPVFRLLDMVGPTAAEEKADAVFIENARSDIPWLIARVRELEAQMEKDAMRIRQLQAQAVKDAVVREAIKTALECLSYRERYWNAEVWDALDVAIVAAEEEAK